MLSLKPAIFVGNVADTELKDPKSNKHYLDLLEYAKKSNTIVVPISAQLEMEIAHLDYSDQLMFLEEYGIKTVIPGLMEQEYVNNIIYDNVKVNKPVDMDKFNLVADNLRNQGADIIILGCSELSMIKKNYDIGDDFIDTMEVLARRCIDLCHGNIKEDYEFLIKKVI